MFTFIAELFGSEERRAVRRGVVWAAVAFAPWFALWTAAGSPRAGVVEGLMFAYLVFPAGVMSGLMGTKER